jgi:hypothetical protein
VEETMDETQVRKHQSAPGLSKEALVVEVCKNYFVLPTI